MLHYSEPDFLLDLQEKTPNFGLFSLNFAQQSIASKTMLLAA
jgi:hypothetical protein